MTKSITVPVTVQITIDPQDLWENTFGTEGTSWSHWHEETFLTGDWDTIGTVRLGIQDPESDNEDDTVTKVIGLNDIVQALQTLLNNGTTCWGHPLYVSGEQFDWDASASDMVLQQAVLGEIVYG
jgi:hypothetical protein